MPGPAPKPTVIRKKQGNLGKKPISSREPMPPLHSGRVPNTLTDGGKWVWRKYYRRFKDTGLLTTHDEVFFSEFCEWLYIGYKAKHKLAEQLEKEQPGAPLSALATATRRNPLLNVYEQASKMVVKLGTLFGMSPADRTRLRMELESDEPTLAELLFEKVNVDE